MVVVVPPVAVVEVMLSMSTVLGRTRLLVTERPRAALSMPPWKRTL